MRSMQRNDAWHYNTLTVILYYRKKSNCIKMQIWHMSQESVYQIDPLMFYFRDRCPQGTRVTIILSILNFDIVWDCTRMKKRKCVKIEIWHMPHESGHELDYQRGRNQSRYKLMIILNISLSWTWRRDFYDKKSTTHKNRDMTFATNIEIIPFHFWIQSI